jgi:hypothetical protein
MGLRGRNGSGEKKCSVSGVSMSDNSIVRGIVPGVPVNVRSGKCGVLVGEIPKSGVYLGEKRGGKAGAKEEGQVMGEKLCFAGCAVIREKAPNIKSLSWKMLV